MKKTKHRTERRLDPAGRRATVRVQLVANTPKYVSKATSTTKKRCSRHLTYDPTRKWECGTTTHVIYTVESAVPTRRGNNSKDTRGKNDSVGGFLPKHVCMCRTTTYFLYEVQYLRTGNIYLDTRRSDERMELFLAGK